MITINKKTAIFYDYDNLYITIEREYTYNKDNYNEEILKKIRELFKDDKILMTKAFCDFNKVKNVLTSLQKNQIKPHHVYSTDINNDDKRKNASDLALAIDVVKTLFNRTDIEQYVIISGDSDMMSLVTELVSFGKEVFLIYSNKGMKDEYKNYLEEWNIKNKSIEEILDIKETELRLTNKEWLNIINNIILDTYNKYEEGDKKVGKAKRKDIVEKLADKVLIGKTLSAQTVDSLLDNNYLEVIQDDRFKDKNGYIIPFVLLNKKKIKEEKIDISEKIVILEDYL